MYVPRSIRTAYGYSSLPPPALISVIITPDELHRFARMLDADAERAEQEGEFEAADRLATRASALREAGRA